MINLLDLSCNRDDESFECTFLEYYDHRDVFRSIDTYSLVI